MYTITHWRQLLLFFVISFKTQGFFIFRTRHLKNEGHIRTRTYATCVRDRPIKHTCLSTWIRFPLFLPSTWGLSIDSYVLQLKSILSFHTVYTDIILWHSRHNWCSCLVLLLLLYGFILMSPASTLEHHMPNSHLRPILKFYVTFSLNLHLYFK